MTVPRTRFVAIALVLFLLIPVADAAKRRRGKSRSKKSAPAGPADAATGSTLSERVTSLMNGSVARSSDVTLQVVDVDTGAGMTSVVGRLRPCGVLDWKFTVLSHNTIRGAAGAAVLNAELLKAKGYMG